MTRLSIIISFLVFVPAALAGTYIGTSGDDTINASWSADYIDAKQGDDFVFAKGGADEIHCGQGEDVCYGSTGSDHVIGGDDFDRLYAGCNGSCDAGPNNDLFGGDGNDQLAADNGRVDEVNGGPGTDTCYVDANDIWISCEIRHINGNL